MIPYGHQEISNADVDAVVEVLRSDFLTQGPVAPRFEAAVAAYAGAQHAVSTCSATAALHLACRALQLGPGDRLWTSAITFVASANCARYCGADVDFVDIDPDTCNISVSDLRARLVAARQTGTLPKVVVTVHLGGLPPAQDEIRELAVEFGFRIIEDAAHAIGAVRQGEKVGSCRWSDITVFSFHPVKIITTGEGGMALTNDEQLAWRMRLLRSHGITRDPAHLSQLDGGPGHQEQIDLGYNYRLTDIQAALGLSQLSRIEEFLVRRNEVARRYEELLRDMPLRLPVPETDTMSSFHLYIVRLRDERRSNLKVIADLRQVGVGATLHYPAMHLQPYYRSLGATGSFPEAERYGRTALSLPIYTSLTDDEQRAVARAVESVTARSHVE